MLREAGVVVKGGDLRTVELVHPVRRDLRRLAWTTTTAAELMHRRRGVDQRREAMQTLFIVPVAARTNLELAGVFDLRLNVVVLDPPQVVLNGDSVTTSPARLEIQEAPRRRGRRAVGRWALERTLLLAGEPRTQGELAGDSGISQQAVSHTLRQLREQAFVSAGPQGFFAVEACRSDLLADWFLSYPGPQGTETYWYGLDLPLEQSRQVAAYAADMDVRALMSGDAAVDTYAPWRTPVAAVVYLSELLDLTAVDLVPATREDATFTAIVPRDHTIWATARSSGKPGLVDPVIALWDLERVGGVDVDQAAARLRAAIVKRDLR